MCSIGTGRRLICYWAPNGRIVLRSTFSVGLLSKLVAQSYRRRIRVQVRAKSLTTGKTGTNATRIRSRIVRQSMNRHADRPRN